jgi:hypothetical protein
MRDTGGFWSVGAARGRPGWRARVRGLAADALAVAALAAVIVLLWWFGGLS